MMLPLIQLLGTMPELRMILKSFSYTGSIKCSVEMMYSLIISSIPLNLFISALLLLYLFQVDLKDYLRPRFKLDQSKVQLSK